MARHGTALATRADWRWLALAALPALVLAAWQAAFPWPFFSDDAFISLRYAQRLLAGDGLTWTDGERVEGYSNLLWVLGTAGLGALGIDLVLAARGLGAAATAAGLVLLARAFAPHDRRSALLAAVPPLLAASAQVVLGWTLGGLEGPFVLGFLAWGFAALVRAFAVEPAVAAWPRRTLLAAAVPFALLCWTRPDGPLWVAMTAAALAIATRPAGLARALRTGALFAALPFAAFCAQLLFRVVYHGDVVPNTAHVKAELTADGWRAGLDWLLTAAKAHAGLVLPAFLAGCALLVQPATRARAAVLALPLAAWAGYLVVIGGDHFPGARLLHGAIAPLALLTGLVLRDAALPPRAVVAVAVALLAATGWNVWLARTHAQSLELRGEQWEWEGREVGRALAQAFAPERPLLAVDAAGAVPFYSGLPCLDLLGLCDRTIATTPFPAWLDTVMPGTPKPPGHLRGNGRYVLERAPDLYLFGPPPGRPLPVFVSGAELEEEPAFRAGHRLVVVRLRERAVFGRSPLDVMMWVKIEGRAGVRRSSDGDRIEIPAWLFGAFELRAPLVRRYQLPSQDAAQRTAHAQQLSELQRWLTQEVSVAQRRDGTLHAEILQRTTRLRLRLDAGTWHASVEPESKRWTWSVTCAGSAPAPDGDGFTIAAAGEYEVELERTDGHAPGNVSRVVLTRTPR